MEKVRLGDVCEVVTGSTPKTSIAEYWDGDIDWITPAELTEETYILEESQRKITQIGVQKAGLKPFPKGTVILSSRAPIGKVAIAGKEMYCNQGFKNLICTDRINNLYLYWYLKGKTDFLNSLGRGATFKEISKAIVENIEIPLPSLEEQEKSANALKSCWDVMAKKKEQLKLCDDLVKAQFVKMFENRYRKVQIGDVVSISRGASPRPISSFITDDSDGVNWIKIGDVSENSLYITHTKEKITREGAKKSRAVYKGDFILSNSMSFGRPYILNIDGCVHDGWLIMSDFRDTFDELYLYYAIRNDEVQSQFRGMVNGATVKNLNSDLVKATKIKVPPIELQQRFAVFVQQVDKSKVAIQKSLDEMQLLFDSLMQKYFG